MSNKIIAQEQGFTIFAKEIKNKILSSQYEALEAVNKELINLYWDIGKNQTVGALQKSKISNGLFNE